MKKPLVLIIEDELDLAEIYATTLKKNDFQTEIISDGRKALERLGQVETTPSLIMLDLHLPHIGGAMILQHIRATSALEKIPVIVTTADERQAVELEGTADLVLLKPVSVTQLRELTMRLIGS